MLLRGPTRRADPPSPTAKVCALGVRAAVATDTERPTIAWPTAAQRARREETARRAMLLAWQRGVAPGVAPSVATADGAADVAGALLTILSPSMRTVSAAAMSKSERAELENLARA